MKAITRSLSSIRVATMLGTFVSIMVGCSSPPELLMPTPNLYVTDKTNPFEEVPPALQNNRVGVLYVTDREPVSSAAGTTKYGFKRSRSAAFGVSELKIGDDVSW